MSFDRYVCTRSMSRVVETAARSVQCAMFDLFARGPSIDNDFVARDPAWRTSHMDTIWHHLYRFLLNFLFIWLVQLFYGHIIIFDVF